MTAKLNATQKLLLIASIYILFEIIAQYLSQVGVHFISPSPRDLMVFQHSPFITNAFTMAAVITIAVALFMYSSAVQRKTDHEIGNTSIVLFFFIFMPLIAYLFSSESMPHILALSFMPSACYWAFCHKHFPTKFEKNETRGRHHFRNLLFKHQKCCPVTKEDNLAMLHAVHIKPWKKSSDDEKECENNGFLFAPHVAMLFKEGFISFTDEGDMLIADKETENTLKRWNIPLDTNIGEIDPDTLYYLEFQRMNIFEQHLIHKPYRNSCFPNRYKPEVRRRV